MHVKRIPAQMENIAQAIPHIGGKGAKGGKTTVNVSPDWPEPDLSLLDDRRGDDLPEFPLDIFSPRWREFLARASYGAAVAVDQVALPLLATASSLIGAARRVRASPGWSEPLTLWTAVVGWSGSGKTPGLDVSRRCLAAIERSRRPSVEEARTANEQHRALAKAKLQKWRADVKEAIEKNNDPPDKPADTEVPEAFCAPKFFVSDVTPAGLAPLLRARPRGMLCIADELAGLFTGMRKFGARAFWLEAWCGGPYVIERALYRRARQSRVSIPHLLVGVTGGIQPDKLVAAFEGDQDGLHARLLFGWPAEPEYRPLATEGADVEPAFQEALLRLITLDAGESNSPPVPGDMDELVRLLAALVGSEAACDLEPKELVLSHDAKAEFEAFRERLHSSRAGLDGLEREWFAKGGGNVLRLAGTLAYLTWAMPEAGTDAKDGFATILQAATAAQEPTEISAEVMRNAVQLWQGYFWPHAQACLRQVGLTDRHKDARRVLNWVRANCMQQLSREDIRRNALGRRLDAEQTQRIIDQLVRAKWFRPAAAEPTIGRPPRRWDCHPKLASDGSMELSVAVRIE